MRPPRKTKSKPHPRSLDALFPKPKVKRCPRGHSQTPEWRPSRGCSTCIKEEAEFAARQWERTEARKNASRIERETEAAKLRPLPDPYILWSHDGRRQVFHAARGPRQRSRIRPRA